MIQKVRVDFRLIHGQIIHSWLKAIDADTICIIDDKLLNNPLKKHMLQNCTPSYISLEIYSVEEGISVLKHSDNKNKRYLVLTEDIQTGIQVSSSLNVTVLNIGETVFDPLKKKMANCVYADKTDVDLMNRYLLSGNTIEIQQLANSKKISYNKDKFFIF